MGQYIAGRAFMGFGTSMTLTVGPTLCQEIAHPRYRAQVGSLYTCIYYIAAICSAFICCTWKGIEPPLRVDECRSWHSLHRQRLLVANSLLLPDPRTHRCSPHDLQHARVP